MKIGTIVPKKLTGNLKTNWTKLLKRTKWLLKKLPRNIQLKRTPQSKSKGIKQNKTNRRNTTGEYNDKGKRKTRKD